MKNILVPIDFSDLTDRLINTASEMAQMSGAKIWLLHCTSQAASLAGMSEVPIVLPVPESELPERFPGKHRRLAELTKSLQDRGLSAEMLFVSGGVTAEILDAVDHHQIDLIVMGSHGHGALHDLFVGSVAKSVLHYTSTPTLIVPCEARKEREAIKERVVDREVRWEEPMATPY